MFGPSLFAFHVSFVVFVPRGLMCPIIGCRFSQVILLVLKYICGVIMFPPTYKCVMWMSPHISVVWECPHIYMYCVNVPIYMCVWMAALISLVYECFYICLVCEYLPPPHINVVCEHNNIRMMCECYCVWYAHINTNMWCVNGSTYKCVVWMFTTTLYVW